MNKECENAAMYFYRELGGAARNSFEAHLKDCPACRRELALLQSVQEALQPPAAPGTVVDDLLAKTTRKRSVWAVWKPALVSVLVLGLGVLVFVAGQRPQPLAKAENALAYVSNAFDEDYENFAIDLELFEEDF